MGKQIDGAYVKWPETAELASNAQDQATGQLIDLWELGKSKVGFPPLWGDEVEYAIVRLDPSSKRASVSCRQSDVLHQLDEATEGTGAGKRNSESLDDIREGKTAGYTPEFGKYMVESEPARPYGISPQALSDVERSMRERRTAIERQLKAGEHAFTLSIFPTLEADGRGQKLSEGGANDRFISAEGRYQAARANITARRGAKLDIKVPLFQDKHTWRPAESHPDYIDTEEKYIHLESLIFGPGHCGFQVTFQASDEQEARMLHDQLIPLGPIMMALTASTPIYRGYLADTDARWNQISKAVDDRSPDELRLVNGNRKSAPWSASETYIAQDDRLQASYQRTDIAFSEKAKSRLEAAGMDYILAHHFAHILVRDPLIISKDDADLVRSDDLKNNSTYAHFESLEGTVWPHVRFKLPPPDNSQIGWRVEFRAMETQFTDFENAAFAIFMVLLKQAIARYKPNYYVPLGKVQENMDRAHARDAVNSQEFFWRVDDGSDGMKTMTVDQIVNGSPSFTGLLPLIQLYLRDAEFSDADRVKLQPYLEPVGCRASGRFWTAARWMREFVRTHSEYKGDSHVTERICFDIMSEVKEMIDGKRTNRMYVPGESAERL